MLKQTKAKILFFLIYLVCFQASSQDELSLQEAVSIGLENNFDIRIVRNDQFVAENNYSLGNAGFYPELELSGSKSYTIEDVDQSFLSGEGNNRENAKSDVINASADLNWTIFDGLGMFVTYDKLKELKEAGEINAKITIENTVAAISEAYFRVILEQEKLVVLENTMELSDERLGIAKAKYEVGKASKMEFLAAQVDFNEDKSALLEQKEQLYNSRVELNKLLARQPDYEFTVTSTITPDEQLKLSDLLVSANIKNPNLLFAQRSKNIAYLEMREIQAERLPEIEVFGSFNYRNQTSESGFLQSSRTDGFNYGVSASINVFDGFNKQRRIQNARVEIETNELLMQNLRLQLEADIYKAFADYTNNLTLLELEQENLEIARENASIALDRYKLGKSNALELREAQRNGVEAESRMINAAYATKVAEIELLRLSGKILTDQ